MQPYAALQLLGLFFIVVYAKREPVLWFTCFNGNFTGALTSMITTVSLYIKQVSFANHWKGIVNGITITLCNDAAITKIKLANGKVIMLPQHKKICVLGKCR